MNWTFDQINGYAWEIYRFCTSWRLSYARHLRAKS
jgi:hypothetical protein